MTETILLTGGTGALGAPLLDRMVRTGHPVRVLSRRRHPPRDGVHDVVGDLDSGDGVDAAVAGMTTVVHAAGSAKGDAGKASRLVAALQGAGVVQHLVFISVVGADTTPFESAIDRSTLGYFEQKRLAELAIIDSGIPHTILRATQFHEFIAAFAELGLRLPVIPSFAGFRYQPIDPREVADRLVELATSPPAGLVDDIAGPRSYPMEELLRSYVRAGGRRRPVLPLHIPGAAARAQRAGANLSPAHAVGTRSWEEFLVERFATPALAAD